MKHLKLNHSNIGRPIITKSRTSDVCSAEGSGRLEQSWQEKTINRRQQLVNIPSDICHHIDCPADFHADSSHSFHTETVESSYCIHFWIKADCSSQTHIAYDTRHYEALLSSQRRWKSLKVGGAGGVWEWIPLPCGKRVHWVGSRGAMRLCPCSENLSEQLLPVSTPMSAAVTLVH